LKGKTFALRIFIILLVLLLTIPAIAVDTKTIPVVTDQLFYSVGDESPIAIPHHRGKVLSPIPPNATVYVKIDGAKRAHDLTGLRGLIRWDEEPPTTVTPSIEYKKVYADDGKTSLGFTYLVAMKIDSTYMISDTYSLKGEVMLGERIAKSLKTQPFQITVMNDAANLPPIPLQYDPLNPIYTPSQNDRTISIDFEGLARFEIDPYNQGEVNISFITAASDEIEASYPDATLRFIGWSHQPIFNRRGVLYLYCESGSYLYQRTINGLQAVTDAIYSKEDGAFVIETMHLGRYVISNKLLDTPSVTKLKPNPPTGAAYPSN